MIIAVTIKIWKITENTEEHGKTIKKVEKTGKTLEEFGKSLISWARDLSLGGSPCCPRHHHPIIEIAIIMMLNISVIIIVIRLVTPQKMDR